MHDHQIVAWPALTTGSDEVILKRCCKEVCQARGSHFQSTAHLQKVPVTLPSELWSQDLVPAGCLVGHEHPLHISSHHSQAPTPHGGAGQGAGSGNGCSHVSARFAGSSQRPCLAASTHHRQHQQRRVQVLSLTEVNNTRAQRAGTVRVKLPKS